MKLSMARLTSGDSINLSSEAPGGKLSDAFVEIVVLDVGRGYW